MIFQYILLPLILDADRNALLSPQHSGILKQLQHWGQTPRNTDKENKMGLKVL